MLTLSLYSQVWIPGGGYVTGAGSERFYESEVLATYADVIVVTINYRLWPFGFFHTGDERMTNGKAHCLKRLMILRRMIIQAKFRPTSL